MITKKKFNELLKDFPNRFGFNGGMSTKRNKKKQLQKKMIDKISYGLSSSHSKLQGSKPINKQAAIAVKFKKK